MQYQHDLFFTDSRTQTASMVLTGKNNRSHELSSVHFMNIYKRVIILSDFYIYFITGSREMNPEILDVPRCPGYKYDGNAVTPVHAREILEQTVIIVGAR